MADRDIEQICDQLLAQPKTPGWHGPWSVVSSAVDTVPAGDFCLIVDKPRPKPKYTCGKTIEGPKVGYRVVLWRKQCGHRVRNEGDRCWQHGGPRVKDR